MSATGTATAKKSAARTLDNGALDTVRSGTDGRTPITKIDKQRNDKLAAARAAQAASDAAAKTHDAEQIANVVVVPKPKAKKATAAKHAAAAEPITVAASTKVCPRCKLVKDLSEFAKDRSSKDGHYSICKADEKLDRERKKAATAAA